MKRLLTQTKVLMLVALSTGFSLLPGRTKAQKGYAVQKVVDEQASAFRLDQVRLLDGPFKHAMDLNAKWLLSLKPDRLLYRFRKNAGLAPKDSIYGGWESKGVSGHSLGHYLSACSMMYSASGDERFKERVDEIVRELALCQAKRNTGYVGAIPDEDEIFDQVSRGDVRSQGFDLNGGWVPWYTVHKVMAGLIDAYTYTGNKTAKTVVVKLADWMDVKFSKLSEAKFQKMLDCEHGGINESLVNVYAITGNKKYLELSYRFHHKKNLDPLAQGRDQLAGQHANTQIPKVIGCARRFEFTGSRSDFATASFFWNEVTAKHTYVIGGNSDHEHFGEPGKLNDRLSTNTTETCNTYNMLKLTEYLYRLRSETSYMDYYERALYNHILASQNPQDGMVLYYMPLLSGAQKPFGTAEDSFWCCTGTGMENHAKYGESIFYKKKTGGLFVNLFIASELDWSEQGLKIRLNTDYPEGSKNILKIVDARRPVKLPILVRYPAWATHGVKVLVNGKEQTVSSKAGSYIVINRIWKKGDQLEFSFPMSLYTVGMPDNPQRKAILYGPVVLAGKLGKEQVKANEIPLFVAKNDDIQQWIRQDSRERLLFHTVASTGDLKLAPLYQVYGEKQAVYWDFYTSQQWEAHREILEKQRREEELLNEKTLDLLRIGEMQPERDHNLTGERNETGDFNGKKWRDAREGGWFSFTLDTKAAPAAVLQCTYYGGDSGKRAFTIAVDGEVIANESVKVKMNTVFYDQRYVIPNRLLNGKKTIVVTFRALPGNTAGGVFGCRLLRID